ncbi:MAG: phospholipase D family protein [Kiritimatiellae bacterium]|nr:phospholipase D family protein [Kiritimatiellia bacterium]
MIEFVRDRTIYERVMGAVRGAEKWVWIATADIKDMQVVEGREARPFLGVLAELVGRGVEVRLIHAKEPGENWRRDFDRYPSLRTGMERMLCPRVHFKCVVADGRMAYFGSANLTGAGMGAKSARKRNFENGVWTDDPGLVGAVSAQFDEVWSGAFCEACGRKAWCGDCPME